MKYGYFDDRAGEYVITTPATPLPWINYLGYDGFYSLISNTGGGYCFCRDAKYRRITRCRYNNVPQDMSGRFYYIKDAGTVWSPGYMPCGTELDSYMCRHGLGYTVLEGEKNGLGAVLTCFVPLGETCEINYLKLKNNSPSVKSVQLYSAVEWCLWNAVDDAQNFQRNLNIGEIETGAGGSVLYHKTGYRERRDHYAFFSVNAPVSGFDTDRDVFLGRFGSWAAPEKVLLGESGGSIADGWSPIASHRIDLTLDPGDERTFVFIIGYTENPPDQKWESENVINKTPAKRLIARYMADRAVESALCELHEHWISLLSRFQLKSPDEKLDRMVNIWNQYQCMVTFNLSRSASYYESGVSRGMGFRDSCQDILGVVHLIPERARERILDLAAIQFEDGSTYHQYQPLTKRGNADIGSGFNDDPLWLAACAAAYIRETGDASILLEPVPFDNRSGSEQPLFEHLRRSIRFTLDRLGPHGLPLIGRADWNDCLNLNCFSEHPDESFQTCSNIESSEAESIFIAAMFVLYGSEYSELCRRYGSTEEAEYIASQVKLMKENVILKGWDGEWFLRAYDAFGNKVGSSECNEGSIYIEPQGFCVMAGIGIENGFADLALSSARKYLSGRYGVEMLYPCYTKYRKELGEITSYPPGYKENGSVFCQNNSWIGFAEAKLGHAGECFGVYTRISPAYIEEFSDIHRTEPYVYSQMIAGRSAKRFGEAKNSWLTATAAWSFTHVSQAILGIRPGYDGLIIDPCVPPFIREYNVTRRFRGAKYLITVHNGGAKQAQIEVDGEPVEGNTVPFVPGKTEYRIEVFM
jgi:cellobiose phosphorylase